MLILNDEQKNICPINPANEFVAYRHHFCSGILY